MCSSDLKLITPPLSSSILDGITRDTVLRIASNLGVVCHESSVSRGELYRADEVFFTGTAAGVTPIVEIDGRTVGNGEEGRYTRMIREEYDSLTRGRKVYQEDWLTWVKADGAQPAS